jgi:hypothetical protein
MNRGEAAAGSPSRSGRLLAPVCCAAPATEPRCFRDALCRMLRPRWKARNPVVCIPAGSSGRLQNSALPPVFREDDCAPRARVLSGAHHSRFVGAAAARDPFTWIIRSCRINRRQASRHYCFASANAAGCGGEARRGPKLPTSRGFGQFSALLTTPSSAVRILSRELWRQLPRSVNLLRCLCRELFPSGSRQS